MVNLTQVQDNFAVFCAGGVTAIFVWYLAKAMGRPVWEALKKIGYRVWDDVRNVVKSLKFW